MRKKAGIFERMREDHRRVLEDAAVLSTAADEQAPPPGRDWPGKEVQRILTILARQFATHMAAEDDVLFPALIEALPQTRLSIEPLCAEHETLRQMLSTLQKTLRDSADPVRNEQLRVQLRDIVDLLRIHIRKEEAIVIGVAERVLQPREVRILAGRMAAGETKVPTNAPGTGRSKGARQ